MGPKKLSRRSQNRLKKMDASLEKISVLVNRVKREDLEELVRRDAIGSTPDGFGQGSSMDGGKGGSSDFSSSVEAAVLAREHAKEDDLHKQLRKIEHLIYEAERSLNQMHLRLKNVFEKEDSERGRQEASSPCAVCMVAPVKKSGLCADDYQNWLDDGRPDRFLWCMYKRGDTHANGQLMVETCPPPSVEVNP